MGKCKKKSRIQNQKKKSTTCTKRKRWYHPKESYSCDNDPEDDLPLAQFLKNLIFVMLHLMLRWMCLHLMLRLMWHWHPNHVHLALAWTLIIWPKYLLDITFTRTHYMCIGTMAEFALDNLCQPLIWMREPTLGQVGESGWGCLKTDFKPYIYHRSRLCSRRCTWRLPNINQTSWELQSKPSCYTKSRHLLHIINCPQ